MSSCTTHPIKRIVLTGGPCAGKTTALVRIIEHFSNLGYKIFTIPEVPTLFTQAGMNYLTDNKDFFYEGEKATLEIQLALEDKFYRLAETQNKPSVIICDRGCIDISVYMGDAIWQDITTKMSTNTEMLRSRYDAVLHLVSAADGAEQFYTTANNAQRLEQANEEGLKIARDLDRKVLKAWTGHSHLRVIDNRTDFDQKMKRVLKEISNVLELPMPIEVERKYIVRVVGQLPECIESHISQTYLTADPGYEVRIRQRNWEDKQVIISTTRKRVSATEETITERQINKSLAESLLQQADPLREAIVKTRKTFIWKGQFFELDFYEERYEGLIILETKGIARDEEIQLPPFLEMEEDITGNTDYYNYHLALKK